MIKDKIKTGIPGLDDMLDGGLIPGRAYVVSGTSGTGKTTLAMQFLLEGARNAERVLYISLDEPPNEVVENMRSYSWDIGPIQVFDATPDILSYDKTPVRDVSTERKVVYFRDSGDQIRLTSDRSPADVTINTIQEMLKQEMKVRKYSRIVIDSLTALRYFYIRTSEENSSMISFFRLLSDIGVTCLVTVQLPEISKPDVETHMARGEIRLHKWFDGRGLMRGVTIEKYRGSSHDHRLRMVKISSDGIVVKTMVAEKQEPIPEDVAPKVEKVEPATAHHEGPSPSTPGESAGSSPQDTPTPPDEHQGTGGGGI